MWLLHAHAKPPLPPNPGFRQHRRSHRQETSRWATETSTRDWLDSLAIASICRRRAYQTQSIMTHWSKQKSMPKRQIGSRPCLTPARQSALHLLLTRRPLSQTSNMRVTSWPNSGGPSDDEGSTRKYVVLDGSRNQCTLAIDPSPVRQCPESINIGRQHRCIRLSACD